MYGNRLYKTTCYYDVRAHDMNDKSDHLASVLYVETHGSLLQT